MKKLVLFAISLTFVLGTSAQKNVNGNDRVWMPSPNTVNDDYNANETKAPVSGLRPSGEKALGSRVLGVTTYDLQTNYTVQDRIVRNSAGDMSVVWTASESSSNSFSDRGAGYSHFDPNTDKWTLSSNYPRIESDRCGWPSILYDGNGGEIIISHSTASSVVRINSRSTVGTGTWSEKAISTYYMVWNRAAMGGTDGNTIHMVAIMNNAPDSVDFQNISNPLLYFRSQDAGLTWDIIDSILPGLDSSAMGTGSAFTVDAYSIIADGNHVAIGIFNGFNDVILMESMDNGDTWTKTIVNDFPYRGFADFKKRHLSDTVYITTSDGSGSIIFDGNGVVHMTYGRQRVTNNLGGSGFFRTFFTDSLAYYRNTNPSYKGFSGYYVNDDTLLNFGKFAAYGWNGVVSYPNLAYGGDTIYLVYSGISDSIASGIDPLVNMRQIYLMRSGDGGQTWSFPRLLTVTDIQFSENVFPDLLPEVIGDRIRLVYHRDVYPSNYVYASQLTGSPPATAYWQQAISDNDVVYLEIDLSGGGIGIGIEKILSPLGETGVYPNPSNGQVDLTVLVYKDMEVTVNVTNSSGQIVHTYNGQPLTKGSNKVQMDLSNLKPGLYMVNIVGGGFSMNEKLIIK